MISFWRERLFHQTWHPSFEELMLYLDGELGAKKMERLGTHTKKCWSCRLRLEKIDRAISEFMEARSESFADQPTFPMPVSASFSGKLDRLEAEHGGSSLFSGLIREYTKGRFAPRVSARLAIFLVSLSLIVAIYVRLNIAQPVSAKEVLYHATQAEVQQIGQVRDPVIYQKVQLSRTSRSGLQTATWEIWNDTRNNRLRQRVTDAKDETRGAIPLSQDAALVPVHVPPVIEDLGEMFRSHKADLGRPLSPANYEVWRASIPQESEEVHDGRLPDGDKATILKVSGHGPFPPDTIVAAEFTVRATDWHPVGERLLVQKQDGVVDYSLGEVAFNVMALNAVPSSIFAEPHPARTQISDTHVRRFLPVSVPIDLRPAHGSLLPNEADLTAAEVEARYALHSVGVCIGRPIAVRMGVGRIEVEGVVDTEDRRTDVLLALRGIPYVAAAIRTVGEEAAIAPAENPDGETAASFALTQPAAASTRKLAIEDLLKQYFTAGKCAVRKSSAQSACVQEEIANLSREALAHSEGANAQAWALRRLVEWEPFLKRETLRTSSRRLVQLMVRDHMEALRSELEQSRAQLKPILAALLGGGSFGSESEPIETQGQGDWVTASLLRLCAGVEDDVTLTLGTFVETNRPVSQPEQAMRDLMAKLDGLNGEFLKLEADVNTELSGSPKPLVSTEMLERK
jgi:hypothetical protein